MLLVILLAVFSIVDASIPHFINPCNDGPDLDECALKEGNRLIPTLVQGHPKYNLQKLDPMYIQQINMEQTENGNVNTTFINLDIRGLRNSKFVQSKMDTKSKVFMWEIQVPNLVITGDYEMRGKFLVLPIDGKGPFKSEFENVKIMYKMEYILEGNKMKLTRTDVNYDIKSMKIDFKNLFKNDKNLEKMVNHFVNKNWTSFHKNMKPYISKFLNMYIRNTLEKILNDVEYTDIFV